MMNIHHHHHRRRHLMNIHLQHLMSNIHLKRSIIYTRIYNIILLKLNILIRKYTKKKNIYIARKVELKIKNMLSLSNS
jgi:hypothetical protein